MDATDLNKTKLSFAVEAFGNEEQTTEESLKRLVDHSSKQILVRNLTESERLQLEEYMKRPKRE